MYLKSIEIQGFKSFANKILFQFHNGITGIVGPNGSGKSNVGDAVRWVLGEQRVKQLRGGSMQDIIFSGTETRKPQGFAYVAITLDNSDHQLAIDYDEVTVSRRLYRSGESEYMINGSACRLKDINEMFYDTGIGKEGYSIIGQGQIDKILSGKPEERRELFDEAAGIVKFKRRKLIAQKKLEDEKQNLIRVSDILTELEKQVGPLARQSESARQYLKLKEELKAFDVNLFLLETTGIKEQIKTVLDHETIVTQELGNGKNIQEQLKIQYDLLDQYQNQLDEQIEASRSGLNLINMQKGNLEGQINVLKEQIHTEEISAEHIQSRMTAIGQEIAGKDKQAAEYIQEKKEIQSQGQEVTWRLAKAQAVLSQCEQQILELERRVEAGKASILEALNEKANLSARQQRYEAMLEQVQVRRAEVSQRLIKYKLDENQQDGQYAGEMQKLDALKGSLKEILEGQEHTETLVFEIEQEVRRLTKGLNDMQQEYHTSHTKLESLRNIAERYEGYGNSIRRVMEVRDRVRGIHGVVADLITVNKQYEVAVETALGGSIQNIVTDSEQTAKQLIDHLKKNKYGRATFLPLTSIGNKNTFSQDRALKEPGVLGLANNLVSADPVYEGMLKYLLGRVVVVDTIDNAIKLARKFQYSLRIVTLEGELLSAGGSMTGGAFKNTSNLLGRKREIEELEGRCDKALKAVDKIQSDLSLNEQLLDAQREELEEVKAKKQNAYLAQNTIQMNLNQIVEKKKEILESSSDLRREFGQLEEQVKELRESRQALDEEIADMDVLNQQVNQDIVQLNQSLEDVKAAREGHSKEVSRVQLEAANLHQKQQFVSENINRLKDETGRLQEEFDGLSSGTHDSSDIIQKKQEEIHGLEETILEAGIHVKDLDAKLKAQLEQKEAKAVEQKGFFKKREEAAQQIAALDKEVYRLQGQKEKLDERLESHTNYMWNEYELTYSTAEQLRISHLTDLPDLRRQIEDLKASIRKLGNVNVNAIEDYKEVSERYEFMKTQYDDLVTAEETLMKIIEELDSGMRRQFEEKFREIRREFDKVFKEMFGGGHGTLELIEGEDILEAGIQIISQPPGKKLQNMMQLSGGEKALTAIALLFAIQNLKPSPFCLLDEIEAALDDSNVDRFAGYLHKLTKHTQFIVITHRRGTMVSADRLYGITMQEKGVSTLVSVNLIEDELEE